MLERLENRFLLAVTTNFSEGVLTVTGDGEANHISLGRNLETGQLVVRSGDMVVGSAPYAEVNSIVVNALGGNDILRTAENVAKPITANGGEGSDNLQTGGAHDVVNGGGGNDTLNGGAGNDILHGGEGSDLMDGGAGADQFNGQAGIDTVTYASRIGGVRVTLDNLPNDGHPPTTAEPGEGDNVKLDVEKVIGGRGNDFMTAAPFQTNNGTVTPGRITFEGGAGNDTLIGSSGGEASATVPNSVLNGGEGNDTLVGGSKIDQLLGGAGNDNIEGNDGNDLINGGPGADNMSGGAGIDGVSYAERTAGVVVTLDNIANDGTPPNAEHPGEGDNVRGDVERVGGGKGNDRLIGNDAPNGFSGGEGNDRIEGGGGNDDIEGGPGNDILYGGAGNDRLFGGHGNDQLFGEAGNDFLHARDGLKDIVDGGEGEEDRALIDDMDEVTGVEVFGA